MSVYLLGSSIVDQHVDRARRTSRRSRQWAACPLDANGKPIEKIEDWPKKPAAGRALAYIAHAEGPGRKGHLPVLRGDVRHHLRHQHHRDPLVRRRQRDGGLVEPRPAVPAAVRHGPGVGAGGPPARACSSPRSTCSSPGSSRRASTPRAARTPPACSCSSPARASQRVIDIWQRREGSWYRRLSWPFASDHGGVRLHDRRRTRSRRGFRD